MDLKTFLRTQWDRVGAWIAIAAGGVILLIGWVGVSAHVYPAEQLPYIISGGLGGVAIIGIGATLWLSADLRDEWTQLHEIARRLSPGEVESANGADATAPERRVVAGSSN
jgi:hypothetical protein